MRETRGRVVEVGTVEELRRRLAAGARSLGGWRLCGLDLAGRAGLLAGRDVAGTTFVGCELDPEAAADLAARGALVLGSPAAVPVSQVRDRLYSPAELYDHADYPLTLDARAYAWSRTVADREGRFAQALHDFAIDSALTDWVRGRRLVGVMGGHRIGRGDPAYAEAARFAHRVGRGLVVATGGGPGAMEAANLGAYLSGRPEAALGEALARLAGVPAYRPSVGAWVDAARGVLAEFPEGTDSLGIPTWHYGHEPANLFATAVAKYFRNALREAILLQLCDAGIVFLPGAAGTVQEVFQDACENYYADEASVAPMILVGRAYWTETLPVWPLLTTLARDRAMAERLHLVDSVEEAANLLELPTESSPGA